jgi:hypothetical protein
MQEKRQAGIARWGDAKRAIPWVLAFVIFIKYQKTKAY